MNSSRFTILSVQGVIGILIVLFGVALLLENLEIIRAGEILRYWPIVLILFGLIKVLERGTSGGKVFGGLLILIGLSILLGNLDIVYVQIWDLWPLLIVLIGIGMIWRVTRTSAPMTGGDVTDSYISGSAILGGWTRGAASPDFKGGQLTATLGGCELDLHGSTIRGDEAVIDVFAFWGGIEISVPSQWRVIVHASPILGGIEDTTKPPDDPSAKRLLIRGTVIMGGVEIKN